MAFVFRNLIRKKGRRNFLTKTIVLISGCLDVLTTARNGGLQGYVLYRDLF